MCGILGGYRYKDSYSFRDLESLRKRGPDSVGTWSKGDVFIGLSRLGIIDPGPEGAQPIENHRYVLAYNGELYNFMEIKSGLQARGVQFKTRCDTEVVLEAITMDGLEVISSFRGFWAFVLYDKHKRVFSLCRDHLGVKPMYYLATGETFCFSSMLKTIAEVCPTCREPDFTALSEYVKYQFAFGSKTFFKNVKRVLPGEIVTYSVDNGALATRRYYVPSVSHDATLMEAQLKEIVETAVLESVVSDVPFTTFCSGGIDSGLVTRLTEPEVAYHANYSDPDCNETRYARKIVEGTRTRLMVTNAAESFSMVDRLNDILLDFDELSIGSVILPLDDLMKLVGERYRLILNGTGGDELFHGYARYFMAEGHCPHVAYQNLFGRMRGLSGVRERFEFLHTKGRTELFRFFEPEVTDRFQSEYDSSDSADDRQKMRLFDMKHFLPGLLNIEDKIAARHSIESRPSLLNQRIVSAALALDPDRLFARKTMKSSLKSAFSDSLPKEVLDRQDKMGFTTPVGAFVNKCVDEIREQIVYSRHRDWYDIRRINFTVDSKWNREIFGLLILDLWLNRYLG